MRQCSDDPHSGRTQAGTVPHAHGGSNESFMDDFKRKTEELWAGPRFCFSLRYLDGLLLPEDGQQNRWRSLSSLAEKQNTYSTQTHKMAAGRNLGHDPHSEDKISSFMMWWLSSQSVKKRAWCMMKQTGSVYNVMCVWSVTTLHLTLHENSLAFSLLFYEMPCSNTECSW